MSIVFLGALVVGYLVLPGVNERIAALERDGKNGEALALLEQRFADGDRSQRTLFQLQTLYEHFGKLEDARRTLEMLAERRPRDMQVLRRLATFYKLTQNQEGYIGAIKRQLAERYSEPACKELIGIYRLHGDAAAEQAMLQDCRAKGYRRPDDIVRLAYLVASDGHIAETSRLLRSVDDRRRLLGERDRLMFFTALLESGEAAEAEKRALRWLKGTREHAFVLLLIDKLVEADRHELAMDMAREAGTPGDSVSLAVAELMVDRDQTVAARAYLKGWLEVARLRDADVVQRFITAALGADDPELAFRGASAYGLSRVSQADLVAMAEALSAVGQVASFQSLSRVLDAATIKENPLLAAAIEFDRGAREPARLLLSRVQVDGLDEWRLALWARLMESTGRSGSPSQALREIGVEPGLAPVAVTARPPIIRRFKPPLEARPPRGGARRKGLPRAAGAPLVPAQKQPAPIVRPNPGNDG
jgi:hypothetical protein